MTLPLPRRPAATIAPPSAGALQVLAVLLEQLTGQRIDPGREWRIETELKPLLRDRGLDSLEQLAAETIAGKDPELPGRIVDALLNQESSFFRDAAVFDMVAAAAAERRGIAPGQLLRVWSAGCSMGQEPLSLAMLFAEQVEATGGRMPDIVATDVSNAAIARARAGRFTQFEIQRGLPVRRMVRWFDAADADWIARPELIRKISFRRVNLVADPLPSGRFDIVLCRNVLLYLSSSLRRQVLDRLATVMRPGGLLVLGAGETVIGQTDAFTPSQRYRGLYALTGAV